MPKTQARLLERLRASPSGAVDCEGAREAKAARALVEAGLAARYESTSGWTGGEYRISPFTRRAYTTKHRAFISGRLHLT